MPQTVSNPHPLQGYVDQLDQLLGQLTKLRYSLAQRILDDQAALRSSNPADRERVLAHYSAMADEALADDDRLVDKARNDLDVDDWAVQR